MQVEVLAAQLGSRIPHFKVRTWQTAQWSDFYASSAVRCFPDSDAQHRRVAALMAGLVERESGGGEFLTPQGPGGVGDRGHAHGLTQIDMRYHATFLARLDTDGIPLWKKPGPNIDYGTDLLTANFWRARTDLPNAPAWLQEMVAVCGFNADLAKVIAVAARGDDPNSITTDKNYGSTIVSHANAWMPPAEAA